MKTKIVLALCALAVALCLVGCTVQTNLPGTSWKSKYVAFAEEDPVVKGQSYTATAFFMKNGVLCLELYMPEFRYTITQLGVVVIIPVTAIATGTWHASNNTVSFDVTATFDNTGPHTFKGEYVANITKDKMEWYNSDGSVNTTWEKVAK